MILSIFIVFTFLFSLFAFMEIREHRRSLEQSFILKATSIAYALDANIQHKDDLKDEATVLSNIHKRIWLDPEILRISLNTPEEDELRIFISSDQGMKGRIPDAENLNSYDNDVLVTKFTYVDDLRVLRVITPVHVSGSLMGTYEFDMTLENVDERINEEVRYFVFFLSTITLLSITIVFIILRYVIIRPLYRINEGVEAIAKGKLGHKVDVTSNDEIGRLGQAFNKMTEDLKKSRKSIEEYSKTLEKKVAERTKQLEESKKDLESKNDELERFNRLAVGREIKMIELKGKIKDLEEKNKDS